MRVFLAVVLIAVVAIAAAGCETKMTNPYITKTDRVDQKLEEGNRGYVKGTPPPVGDRGDLKRPWITVDVDLPLTTKERDAKMNAVAEEAEGVRREVTVIKEETPTTARTITMVREEEIK